jgi:Na+/H+ antiporter NhaA
LASFLASFLADLTVPAVDAAPLQKTERKLHGVVAFLIMALFVAGLAFPGMPALLTAAKLGILAASLGAGICGWILLRRAANR